MRYLSKLRDDDSNRADGRFNRKRTVRSNKTTLQDVIRGPCGRLSARGGGQAANNRQHLTKETGHGVRERSTGQPNIESTSSKSDGLPHGRSQSAVDQHIGRAQPGPTAKPQWALVLARSRRSSSADLAGLAGLALRLSVGSSCVCVSAQCCRVQRISNEQRQRSTVRPFHSEPLALPAGRPNAQTPPRHQQSIPEFSLSFLFSPLLWVAIFFLTHSSTTIPGFSSSSAVRSVTRFTAACRPLSLFVPECFHSKSLVFVRPLYSFHRTRPFVVIPST